GALRDSAIDTFCNLLDLKESGRSGFAGDYKIGFGLGSHKWLPRQSPRCHDKPGGFQSPKDLATSQSRRSGSKRVDRVVRLIRQSMTVVRSAFMMVVRFRFTHVAL